MYKKIQRTYDVPIQRISCISSVEQPRILLFNLWKKYITDHVEEAIFSFIFRKTYLNNLNFLIRLHIHKSICFRDFFSLCSLSHFLFSLNALILYFTNSMENQLYELSLSKYDLSSSSTIISNLRCNSKSSHFIFIPSNLSK